MTSDPPREGRSQPCGDRFLGLPLSARVLIGATVPAGFASLAWASALLRWDRPSLFIELLALAIVTATVKVSLPLRRSSSTMSLSVAIALTALLVLGTPEALVIGVLSAWTQCTFRMKASNPIHRTLFSIASVALSVRLAGAVFALARGTTTGYLDDTLRPLGLATLAYFAVNTGLVAAAIALATRQRVVRVWMGSFLWSAPGYMAAACAAAFAAGLSRQGGLAWGALVAVPLFLTYRSYRAFIARIDEERAQVRMMSDVQLATIEALALAIEVKDRTPHAQIRRMQIYAEGLARAAGMSEGEIHAVKTAAMLHDIGHLAVPAHILGKPGPLTAEEYDRVKIHPRVGAEILASVPFPNPVTPLIAAHHERWDGRGYPEGCAGGRIPLGARVLAIVDTFTSLLVDRPYRRAHARGDAVEILRRSAGASLDPALVERFIELLPELEARLQADGDAAPRDLAAPAGALGPDPLGNIADAQHEATVLYEIAQTLGTSLGVEDTVALIEAKLRGLLPFSCCALYLRDATAHYAARVAVGAERKAVLGLRGASLEWLAHALPHAEDAETALRSVLVAPLDVGGKTFGAFAVYDRRPDAYDADHGRVLDLVARHAAPVIQNAVVFEETQEASLTDPLTGLANRRALQAHLQKELARAGRQHAPVSLLLLDMDGLKYFNDTYGHHMGDRALREVAAVLQGMLRPYDLCARYEGDEFVITLWECDAAQSDHRRRELQAAVAAVTIDVGQGRTVALGISAGAATYDADGTTGDALLAAADARMYRDKVTRRQPGGVVVPIREPAPPRRQAIG